MVILNGSQFSSSQQRKKSGEIAQGQALQGVIRRFRHHPSKMHPSKLADSG